MHNADSRFVREHPISASILVRALSMVQFILIQGVLMPVHAKKLLFGVLCSAILTAGSLVQPAYAQVAEPSTRNIRWPQATLQAQANITVPQDAVRITQALEVSADTQTIVAERLNAAVKQVLDQAKDQDRVRVRSGAYRVWPMNDNKGLISNWRGRAEIILDATDFVAASELSGKLSGVMPVTGINFYLSPEARSQHESDLLKKASHAFRERAQAVADSFGYARYELREINLGGSGATFESMPRAALAMSADRSSAPVPMEPGTEQVSVTVSGSIFLRSPRQ